MKRLALFVLAVSLVAVPTAAAKKPPSFALWVARWSTHSDAVDSKATDPCNVFVKKNDDKRAGECFVAAELKIDPGLIAEFNRQVAAISKPQKPACRTAIHAYWKAASKTFAAFEIYLRGHQHTAMTDISGGITEEPYATLTSVKDSAKSRAVRVCG